MLFKKKSVHLFIFLLAMLLFVVTANAMSRENDLPLWEIGLGAGSITMPSYRGAKNQELYPVPMPYVAYRGTFLRVDREGIRGLLYDSNRIQFDFSGDGAVPSATDKDGPRQGMPDLDLMLEFGPSINFIFYESARARIRMRLPIRAAVASDFSSIYHAGWKFHPDLNVDIKEAIFGWDAVAAVGPLFADRDYHAFYYEVAERYADTAFRNTYRAGGGYSGASLTISATRRFDRIWAGMFFRYDNLSGAAFIDSPLVETRHSFMAGLGMAYIFWKSKKSVPAAGIYY